MGSSQLWLFNKNVGFPLMRLIHTQSSAHTHEFSSTRVSVGGLMCQASLQRSEGLHPAALSHAPPFSKAGG